MKKVYIVIELKDDANRTPRIVGVYSSKEKAERVAYADSSVWSDIIEKVVY